MSKKILFLILIVLAATTVTVLLSTKKNSAPATNQPVIATTIFPLYDIVRHVAGPDFKITFLLPPGASPHTFEPTPSTLKELRGATVLYTIGHKIDDWAVPLADSSSTAVITVDRNIKLRNSTDEDDHGGADPHYFLTVPNAKIIATTVADDLAQRFPKKITSLQQNLTDYLTELDATDQQLRQILAPLQNKKMVTLHDAWYYFAEEYGLQIVASFEPSPGREPTPQYLAALGQAVDQAKLKTIYSEPQLSTATLEPFAQDHHVAIAVLDPNGGVTGRESLTSLLIYDAQIIANNQ